MYSPTKTKTEREGKRQSESFGQGGQGKVGLRASESYR
jgi:hypothetical protein